MWPRRWPLCECYQPMKERGPYLGSGVTSACPLCCLGHELMVPAECVSSVSQHSVAHTRHEPLAAAPCFSSLRSEWCIHTPVCRHSLPSYPFLPLPSAARCTCATPDCAPANVAAHLQSMALTEHCCQATMVCTVRAGIFETRRARPLVCLLLRLVRRVTCAFVLYTHTVPSTTSRLSGQI